MRIKVIKDEKKYQGDYLAESYISEDGKLVEHYPIENPTELEMAVFCIEEIAREKNKTGFEVYKAMTKVLGDERTVLDGYVTPCSEVLRTQSRSYVVADVLGVMDNWRVSL